MILNECFIPYLSYSSSGSKLHILHPASCIKNNVGISLNVLTIHQFSWCAKTCISSMASKSEYLSLRLKFFIFSSVIVNIAFFCGYKFVFHQLIVPVLLSFCIHLFWYDNEYIWEIHYFLWSLPSSLSVCVV